MTFTERHIVESYTGLLDGLSSHVKQERIVSLTKSLSKRKKSGKEDIFKSFGAFGSNESAEEIIFDIKTNRKFRKKNIQF